MKCATGSLLFASILVLAHGCDCGGTPPGTGDAAAADGWVANRPPLLPAYASVTLLPGDTAALVSEPISDPDGDPVTCSWDTSATLPGVVVPTGCDTPAVAVDRALYESGPTEQRFTLTATVSDGVNPAATAVVEVIIGDERGGHVNNVSPWEGTGYQGAGSRHGFCGSTAHPCKSVDDAMANLRAQISSGAALDPTIQVATSGVDYTIGDRIVLDDDPGDTGIALNLECGFDPASWERVTDSWTHTPFRFTGSVGVSIAADGVRLAGCEITGAEPTSHLTIRVAVEVENAAATILNNRLLGQAPNVTDRSTTAIGLRLRFADADSVAHVAVIDNTIVGGAATDDNIGLSSENGAPLIQGNRIRGSASAGSGAAITRHLGLRIATGDANGADRTRVRDNPTIEGGGGAGAVGTGIQVVRGSVDLFDNDLITGCASDCERSALYTGLLSSATGETVSLVNNTIQGATETAVVHGAIGVQAFCRTLSQRNTISGGQADFARGLVNSGGDCSTFRDTITGGIGVDADPGDDSDGSAVGIQVAGGYVVAVEDQVVGARTGTAANADHAIGVRVEAAGRARAVDSQIRSGRAAGNAYGIEMPAPGTAQLTLERCTVEAGTAGTGIGDESIGVRQNSGTLTVTGGSISGGAGSQSTAVRTGYDNQQSHGANATTLAGCTLQTAPAQNGFGLVHHAGALDLSDVTATVAHTQFNAYGLYIYCDEDLCKTGPHTVRRATATVDGTMAAVGIYIGLADDLLLADSRFTAGTADPREAVGVWIKTETNDVLQLRDVTATAGHATVSSFGLRMAGPGLAAIRLTASSAGAPLTGGVDYLAAVGGYINDSVLDGGDCDSSDATASYGLRIATHSYTHFERNVLRGGDGCGASYGYYLEGGGFATWLHDSVAIGGQAENYSAGAWYAAECQACRIGYNWLRGGSTTSTTLSTARSIGLRMTATEFATESFYKTHIFSNRIHGGSSKVARGLELTGGAGEAVVVMHNNIHGQGASGVAGSVSSAVYLGRPAMVGLYTSGLFAFNIIDAGVADDRFGFEEACSRTGGVGAWGAPWQVRKNVFWPTMSTIPYPPTAYVRHANTDDCAAPTLYTTLSQVNADAHYGQGVAAFAELAVDPDFERDGVHLKSTSPLIEAAGPETLWPYDPQMDLLDIDAEARPCSHDLDIGADEYCP